MQATKSTDTTADRDETYCYKTEMWWSYFHFQVQVLRKEYGTTHKEHLFYIVAGFRSSDNEAQSDQLQHSADNFSISTRTNLPNMSASL